MGRLRGWGWVKTSSRKRAISYRSKLEADLASGVLRGVAYEAVRLPYELPTARYTPDFILPNGIALEAKGVFTGKDRTKSLLVREQHPGLELRFIFMTPYKVLSPASLTTYAIWCDKHGFQWCHYKDHETIKDWIGEAANAASLKALNWQPEVN